ncbi:MAG TPA: asparagine synthase-related protein [Acidobacteriaceae bacterium]|nr:asparagine synthase-related protein [Acidobacteriaceae bacterium]
MAGIAGIFCTDGRPADVSVLRSMADTVVFRGPDGIAYWNAGPVALAHMQFFTTPESLEERQPLVSQGGEACLVWNGRVDNREELKSELEAAGARAVDDTDPGLVLAAYLEWGTECVQRIVGDFALALWDARTRRLWCASDFVGIRPFYYFWDGKTFVFGPDVHAVLAHPLVSLKINEGMVGEYLLHQIRSRRETLYVDVRRLEPGRMLEVDSAGLRTTEWWRPDLSLLDYETDAEYAEHFRHLFDLSLKSKMRCHARWGIELSGGLDSSSIAVSARAILDREGRGEEEILAYSVTSPGKPWDESEDIRAVVDKARLTASVYEPLRVGLEFFRGRAEFWRDYPGTPNGEPLCLPMFIAVREHGVRVLMNGIGGDEVLMGRGAHLLDLAKRLGRPGSMRALLDRARYDCDIYTRDVSWQSYMLRRLTVGFAPSWARKTRRKLGLERHGIFTGEFLRRTNLGDRVAGEPELEHGKFASSAQQTVYFSIASGSETHLLAFDDREKIHAGIETRYPFLDRRVVEFCLRLPENQRQKGPVWKWLLRNAMEDRLPQQVLNKLSKAEFSEIVVSVLSDPQAQERFGSLRVESHTDWLDSRRLREQLDRDMALWPKWRLLAIDLWFAEISGCG